MILLVVVFVAAAIAALAAVSSGRVVAETRHQRVLESESRANNTAFARLHLALNIINNSSYDAENHNLELRDAIAGVYGGTAAGEPDTAEEWLQDPEGVYFGLIRGTDVRAYQGRDYIKRLAKLKGLPIPTEVDPLEKSENYFVIEALGRSGDTVRVVSALVRENEPFSSFVFFQNRHPLGISGRPRGLIHANETIEFYFPNGSYVDSVSAVLGFDYKAGATPENTSIADGNPEAPPISLEDIDFAALREKAELFVGEDGLDAEIALKSNGGVQIKEFTPPHWEPVEYERTETYISGYETQTVSETQTVQVGTVQEERVRTVIVGYDTEVYTVTVPVYEDQVVERTREVPIYEDQLVVKTRQVPIYETQTVVKTRWVQVFVPYETDDAEGGTAVGGGGDGVPGEYVWVQEEYETQEQVIVGYETETYTVTERVLVGTYTETYTVTVTVQVGTIDEERTRQVPIYGEETYTVDVPVYEDQVVSSDIEVPIYDTRTYIEVVNEFFYPTMVRETNVDIGDAGGTIYIDGRITRLGGDLRGRLTIVGNEKIRVTGSIRYVDANSKPAMLNGDDYTLPYLRNSAYSGRSTLGVIARKDILLTNSMPNEAEINGTLMAVEGRVGIDGMAIREDGEPTTWYLYGLTDEERQVEYDYNRTSYRTSRFTKDSLRRMGGIISNDRILETYIRERSDGTSYVYAGFKRGRMLYDISLLFNPPPNFVEVPRPVVTYYVPVFFMRGDGSDVTLMN